MKNIILILILFFLTTNGYADDESLSSAEDAAGTVLDLVFLGAKVVGAIAVVLGINEMLVEKDQGGQQGKKVSGSMKLLGGILLMGAAQVISWAINI